MDFGDLPREDGRKNLNEQVAENRRYLYKLREDLSYILQNLTEENWNETALQRLREQFAPAAEYAALAEEVAQLKAMLSAAQTVDEEAT